jgi:hypothetical protein
MEFDGNRIIAAEGKALRRKSDGWIAGPELWIGYTYYIAGIKLVEPLLELPEHYGEVDIPEEFAKEIPLEYPGMNDGGYVSPFFRHTCLLRFIQR